MKDGYESMALIPLRINEETFGLLQMNDKKSGLLQEETIRFLEGIGQSIAITFKRRQIEEEVKNLSNRDPLTGLYNQLHFFVKIREEVNRARRMSYPLTLMIISILNFQEYSKKSGDRSGQKLLKDAGQIIGSAIKQDVDTLFRYGNAEYAVILPHVDAGKAPDVLERILQKVGVKKKDVRLGIGYASTEQYDDVRDIIKAADDTLRKSNRQHKTSMSAK
jgi:diguanylate cyclase (GGDEF)-like protein